MLKTPILMIIATFIVPINMQSANADHMPNGLSQSLDPDYIACLLSVQDASDDFRYDLETRCAEKLISFCAAPNDTAPHPEVIHCLSVELSQGMVFFTAATNALPESIDREGFFGHLYPRHGEKLLNFPDTFQDKPIPQDPVEMIHHFAEFSSNLHILLWAARETETPLAPYLIEMDTSH